MTDETKPAKDGDYQGYEEWREWWHERQSLLEEPLSQSKVKTRAQAGRQLSYIEGWHVIAEANRIFGFGNWSRETVLLQETNRDLVTLKDKNGVEYQQWRIGYIAKVRIHAPGVLREGTGYGSGMGKPEAIGDAVEGAVKEAETDAMKRALMTFGNQFGLALYDKDQANVGMTKAEQAEEAEKALQEKHKWAESYAQTFIKSIVDADGLVSLQATIDKCRDKLDWIKENFPDVDDELQREIDKAYKRIEGFTNA